MLSLTPLLVFTATLVYAFGTIRLMNAMEEAPLGYENQEGFHYGLDMAQVAVETEPAMEHQGLS